MDMNEISNEMLAFQADLIHVHEAGKTQSVSDRPHEECKAFRMNEALNFYKNNIKTNLYNMPFSESSGIDSKIQLSC